MLCLLTVPPLIGSVATLAPQTKTPPMGAQIGAQASRPAHRGEKKKICVANVHLRKNDQAILKAIAIRLSGDGFVRALEGGRKEVL